MDQTSITWNKKKQQTQPHWKPSGKSMVPHSQQSSKFIYPSPISLPSLPGPPSLILSTYKQSKTKHSNWPTDLPVFNSNHYIHSITDIETIRQWHQTSEIPVNSYNQPCPTEDHQGGGGCLSTNTPYLSSSSWPLTCYTVHTGWFPLSPSVCLSVVLWLICLLLLPPPAAHSAPVPMDGKGTNPELSYQAQDIYLG